MKHKLGEKISVLFFVFDEVPEEDDERLITIGILARWIKRYWVDLEEWETTKELGTPKLIAKYKKLANQSHDKKIKTVMAFFRDIINQDTDLYKHITPLSEQTVTDISRYIKDLLNVDITKDIEDQRIGKQPSKNEITEMAKYIFDHYKLDHFSDFKRSLLPLI